MPPKSKKGEVLNVEEQDFEAFCETSAHASEVQEAKDRALDAEQRATSAQARVDDLKKVI